VGADLATGDAAGVNGVVMGRRDLVDMYIPSVEGSDDEDEIEKWMRQQFAATPMPKPYAAEEDDSKDDSSSSSSSSSLHEEYTTQQQQPAAYDSVQLPVLEQQQQPVYQLPPPLVLPAALPVAVPVAVPVALPVALPVSAEAPQHVVGSAPYNVQQTVALPPPLLQQPAVEEDATDEELLALLLSS
jgi:hypothetical protein